MDNIKTAFGGIKAEEHLKEDTLMLLRYQMQKRSNSRSFFRVKQIYAAFASMAIIAMGAFSHNLYFTERAYVDLDVNPSVELSINRFDRVIGAYAYNTDGENVLEGLSIKHKNYADAVGITIDAMARQGFVTDSELVSVTLQASDKDKEESMLSNIESTVMYHHGTAQVEAFLVDDDTRDAAHDANMSPAKYLAILDLQTVDPTASIDNCRGHSVMEIKKLTEEHSVGHHGNPASPEMGNDAQADKTGSSQIENTHKMDNEKTGHNGHKGGNSHE